MGKGSSSGGGGGSSGAVSWPSYLQDSQHDLLRHGEDHQTDLDVGISMFDAINDAWGNSPYSTATSYDPATDLGATQDRFDDFNTFLTGIDPETNFGSYQTAAAAAADDLSAAPQAKFDDFNSQVGNVVPIDRFEEYTFEAQNFVDGNLGPDYVASVVDSFEARQTPQIMRRISRLAASARDQNAVNSAAFQFGMALIEQDAQRDLDEFAANLDLKAFQDRQELTSRYATMMSGMLELRVKSEQAATTLQLAIAQSEGERTTQYLATLSSLLQLRTNGEQSAAQLQGELNRVRIVASKEFLAEDVELAVQDGNWNLGIFQHASNLLSAVAGGVSSPMTHTQERRSSSMLAGAIGGGASGALLGMSLAPATGGMSIAIPLLLGAAGAGASFL